MTIKELKALLADMPEDATAFFTLWTVDGAKNYWFNPTGGKKIYSDTDGNKFAQIAYTDQCRAQQLVETETGLKY